MNVYLRLIKLLGWPLFVYRREKSLRKAKRIPTPAQLTILLTLA